MVLYLVTRSEDALVGGKLWDMATIHRRRNSIRDKDGTIVAVNVVMYQRQLRLEVAAKPIQRHHIAVKSLRRVLRPSNVTPRGWCFDTCSPRATGCQKRQMPTGIVAAGQLMGAHGNRVKEAWALMRALSQHLLLRVASLSPLMRHWKIRVSAKRRATATRLLTHATGCV